MRDGEEFDGFNRKITVKLNDEQYKYCSSKKNMSRYIRSLIDRDMKSDTSADTSANSVKDQVMEVLSSLNIDIGRAMPSVKETVSTETKASTDINKSLEDIFNL